jgi:hypothetical protein
MRLRRNRLRGLLFNKTLSLLPVCIDTTNIEVLKAFMIVMVMDANIREAA